MLIWPLACAQYARNSHQGASPLEMDWGKALRISRGGSPRVKNELCRAHPCAQEQAPHRCFLLAQRKRLAMYHHSLIFHDLLNSVMFQGKESHRLTRSSHNLCQPLPACSNASLRLHTLTRVSGHIPQPHTYSQSSFIFFTTEGSWFLQQERSQLLIPSKSPSSFSLAVETMPLSKGIATRRSHQDSQGQHCCGKGRRSP